MIRHLPPLQLNSFLANNTTAILLDVREPWEFDIAAIDGARLVPLGTLSHAVEEDEMLNKESTIIIYCHHGIRSLQACAVLSSLGYTDLLNLTGGIDRYSREVDASVPTY